jgi:hypothetical protein
MLKITLSKNDNYYINLGILNSNIVALFTVSFN